MSRLLLLTLVLPALLALAGCIAVDEIGNYVIVEAEATPEFENQGLGHILAGDSSENSEKLNELLDALNPFKYSNPLPALLLTGGVVILFLVIAVIVQRRRNRNW